MTASVCVTYSCGPGQHAVQLERQGSHVIAVDLSVPMLEYARRKAGPDTRIDFRKDDMRHFSLEV